MTKVCLVGYCMNAEVRKHLAWGWRGKPGDIAIWNTELVKALGQRDDIELHVIAPAFHLRHLTQTFQIGRVHYYYFKPDVPFLHISWKNLAHFDQRTNYWWTRRVVQRWIRQIKPDIVNLTGAENPHYSASILGLKGVPVLVSMQGIYSNPIRFKTEKENPWRTKFERAVHAENRYFGLNAGFMKELIQRDAPEDAVYFWNRPLNKEADLTRFVTSEKKYDFVFFSRMNVNKGAPDVIKAAAIVRKRFPHFTIRMFGFGSQAFEESLNKLITEGDLRNNIIRSAGYAEHNDLMAEVAKARYHILPTYIDTIPCTIFEGLRLGLPFVGYKTGDIPKLNLGDERVLLSKPGDVEDLAQNMMRFLENPLQASELQQKALNFVDAYFSNRANVTQLLAIYQAIISHYHKGAPIPQELLYDHYLQSKKLI